MGTSGTATPKAVPAMGRAKLKASTAAPGSTGPKERFTALADGGDTVGPVGMAGIGSFKPDQRHKGS